MRYSNFICLLLALAVTTCFTGTQAAEEEFADLNYEEVDASAYADSQVVLNTTLGDIVLNLFPETAPKHVASFVTLVNAGFYDSLTFHRAIRDVLIQGGSPGGRPDGKGPWTIPAEFSDIEHVDGTLAMARPRDINGASCQFYITLRRVQMYDGKYTVFGEVADSVSLAVAHEISRVETTGQQQYPRVSDKPLKDIYIEKAIVRARPGTGSTEKSD